MSDKKIRPKKKSRRKARKTAGADNLQVSAVAGSSGSAAIFNFSRAQYGSAAIAFGIIILLVFAAHAITIWGEFVYLDLYNLSEIRYTRDWNRFWSDLMLNSMVSPLNEPLVKLSLAIDVLSMGIKSPGIFHAINMLLHLGNCLAIYLLVRRLAMYKFLREKLSIEPDFLAFATVAIFACHPLGSGAISYISARSALLVTLNYMISLHLFLSGFLSSDIKKALFLYLFSYLFVIFGIWSGPQAVTIPGAFIVLALLLKPEEESIKSWVMDRPFEFFAQLLVSLGVPLVLLLNFSPLVGNGFGLQTLPLMDYIATQFKVLVTYTLRCFLVPYGLSLDPPMTLADSLFDPFSLLGIALVALAAYLSYRLRNSIIPSFALALFVLSLIPSCFVPHPEYVSITRIYLTMASLSIISGYFLVRFSVVRPISTIIVSTLIILSLVGLSNYRNWQWHEDIRLWESARSLNPESKRSRAMYAWALEFNGQMDRGYEEAKIAYKEDKTNPILNLIIGTFLLEDQKYKEAFKYFEDGVKIAEKENLSREIQYKLETGYAAAAVKTGKYEIAYKYADKALRIQKSSKLYLIQGVSLMARDNPHGAFMKLQESYLMDKLNPEVIEPLTRAALGCGTKQLQDLAYNMSKQAYRVHGLDPHMLLLRAYASLETGRVNEALGYIHTYLKSEKPNAESLYLMHGVYKKLGKEKEAKVFLDLALTANPNIRKEMRLYLNREIVKPNQKQKTGAPKNEKKKEEKNES